ncbi:MAG: rhodanese-like domain-containing protein [Candidatus Aminicenantes bacterium]|nr:rhodanese-like domain-containing protein [Candidatus Aminicenantes bacterium]
MTLKKFVLQLVIILGISIIAGFVYNGLSGASLPVFKKYVPVEEEDGAAYPEFVDEIDVETLKALLDSDALLFDARTREDYCLGHLPGAVSFPVYEFDDVFGHMGELLSEGRTIIAYCSSVTCIDSTLLVKKLYAKGHRDVFVYRGGYTEWTELNNPVTNPQDNVEEGVGDPSL